MGNVERCDKTLPPNKMIYCVRKDPALRARDVRRLNELGVHQYSIPQILRLFYGASLTSDSHPALEAYRRASPEETARSLALAADGAEHVGPAEWFDDGISVPMHFLNPDGAAALVPITMNCTVPPIPTPGDCYEVALTLRAMLRPYPGRERIAMLGSGGLSHDPGGPRSFRVDEEFDRWFLGLLERGDHEALLRDCTLERMEAAGSGGTAELNAWIMATAFTRGPVEVLADVPAVAWRSGTGMVVWNGLAN